MNNLSGGKSWPVLSFVLLVLGTFLGCGRSETETATSIMANSKPGESAAQNNKPQKVKLEKEKLQSDKPKPKSDAAVKPAGKLTAPSTISWIATTQLLPSEKVQNELQLTPEQKKRFAEIDKKRLDALENFENAGEGTYRTQMAARMLQVRAQLSKEVAEILNESQRKQLARIEIQVNGVTSLLDPYIALMLKISDEQQRKLLEIRSKKTAEMQKANKPVNAGPSPQEMARKSEEIRTKVDNDVLALLTDQQKRDLAALRKPIPVSSLTTAAMATKLGITDAQKAQLNAIQKSLKQQQTSLKESKGSDKTQTKELTAKLQALTKDSNEKMMAVLTPQQKQAFDSLPRQPRRPSGLTEPAVAANLNLTDDQKAKLAAIGKTDIKDIEILSKEIRKKEDAKKKATVRKQELRSESDELMLAILTADQRLQFAALKGNSPRILFRDLQAPNDSTKKALEKHNNGQSEN